MCATDKIWNHFPRFQVLFWKCSLLFFKKMLWIPTFFSGATQNPAVLRDGFGKRRVGRGEEFRPERKMSYLSDSLVENFFPPLPHVHPVAKRNARIPNSKLKVPHFRSSGFFIMHVLVIYPWQMSHPAKQVSWLIFHPEKKVNFAVSSYLSQTRQSARCPQTSLCAKASSAARSPWRTGHCCSAHSRRRWRRLRHLRRTAPRMRHFRYLRGRHCWTTFASWTTPGASSIRRTSLLTVFPVSIFGTVNFCSAMEQGQKR